MSLVLSAQHVLNAGKAEHQSQAQVEREESRVIEYANAIADAVAWYGKKFVHHDL